MGSELPISLANVNDNHNHNHNQNDSEFAVLDAGLENATRPT